MKLWHTKSLSANEITLAGAFQQGICSSVYARNIKGLIMTLQFQANQPYSPALCAPICCFYLRLNTYSFLSVTQWTFLLFVREGNVTQISSQPNESAEFSWGLRLPVSLRQFVCVWVLWSLFMITAWKQPCSAFPCCYLNSSLWVWDLNLKRVSE